MFSSKWVKCVGGTRIFLLLFCLYHFLSHKQKISEVCIEALFLWVSTVGGMFLWWRRVVLLTLRQSHAWGDPNSSMKCDCLGGRVVCDLFYYYIYLFFITEFGFWSFQKSDCVHWVWFVAEWLGIFLSRLFGI